MSTDERFRRIRGVFGNAVVFAVGWTVGAFTLWLVLRQARIVPHLSILSGVGIAVRFGVMGFITGAIFPGVMILAYRGRRLSEIGWVRFGIVGGIVTGLFVPTFMEVMNVLSGGGGVPMRLIRLDIVLAAGLGAVMAAFSLKLAQYVSARFPDTFQSHVDRMERKIRLTSGGPDLPITRPSRSADLSELPRRDS